MPLAFKKYETYKFATDLMRQPDIDFFRIMVKSIEESFPVMEPVLKFVDFPKIQIIPEPSRSTVEQ